MHLPKSLYVARSGNSMVCYDLCGIILVLVAF